MRKRRIVEPQIDQRKRREGRIKTPESTESLEMKIRTDDLISCKMFYLFITFLLISCPVIRGGLLWGSPTLSSLKGLQTPTSTPTVQPLKVTESSRGNAFIYAIDKYSGGPRRRLKHYNRKRNAKQASAHMSKIQEESKMLPLRTKVNILTKWHQTLELATRKVRLKDSRSHRISSKPAVL